MRAAGDQDFGSWLVMHLERVETAHSASGASAEGFAMLDTTKAVLAGSLAFWQAFQAERRGNGFDVDDVADLFAVYSQGPTH